MAKKNSKETVGYRTKASHIIKCTDCGREFEVDILTKEIVCSDCTVIKMLKLYGVPKGAIQKEKKEAKKPPGWHFYKEFVDKDGRVYHKGVEKPKLFGTKDPTKIKPTKKKTRKLNERERGVIQRELFEKINAKEKQLNKLIKSGKKRGKKGLQKEINKLKKEVRKYL